MIGENINDGFIWKDLHSRDDMNIVCESVPQEDIADTRIEQIIVPGRSGFLTVEKEGHEPITKSVTFHLLDEQEVDKVKQWLTGTDKGIFSNEPDRYYKATIISKVELNEVIPILHKGIIQFECQPYGYLLDGDYTITINSSGTEIYNPGTYKSEPHFKIYATGDIKLIVNEQILAIKNVVDYVEVDTDLDMVYKDTVSKDGESYGDCPTIAPGINTISWKGTVTKIEIIPRWRCL